MTSEGEVTETNMDDIEISIASKYDTFLRKEMKKNKEINRRL